MDSFEKFVQEDAVEEGFADRLAAAASAVKSGIRTYQTERAKQVPVSRCPKCGYFPDGAAYPDEDFDL